MAEKNTQPTAQNQSKPEQKEPKQYMMSDETKLATLCYVAIGFIIPLLTQPQNQKLHLHIKQGMVLLVGWLVILIVLVIMPSLGLLLFLAYFGLNVIALFRAYNGESWKIPVIGDFAEKLPLLGSPSKQQQTQPGAQEEPKEENKG